MTVPLTLSDLLSRPFEFRTEQLNSALNDGHCCVYIR